MKLYNQGFPFLYNTFCQGGPKFCQGGRAPSPGYASAMQSSNHDFFCIGVVYSGEYDVCDVTLSVYPHRACKLEKYARPRWESNLRPLEYKPNALPTELRGTVIVVVIDTEFSRTFYQYSI